MSFEAIFWAIHLPLMFVFLIGLADVFGIWLKGRVEGLEKEASAFRKLSFLVRKAVRTVFSPWLPLFLKAFVTEAWFNRRLWQASRWRWLSHFLLLNGFLLLMGLSALAALADKILRPLFHLGHIPWIAMWYTADHPLIALLNEIGGVMMTAGLLFYIVRRYAIRPKQLRTGPLDNWVAVSLGLILLSGWAAEIVRLCAEYDGPSPQMAFIGYPISRLLRGFALPWEELAEWLFLAHGLFTSAVIALIPYSKFMHVVATALMATLESVREEVPPDFHFSFRQIMALDACTRCGECINWCPTFAEKPELDSITPLRKIEAARGLIRDRSGLKARLFGSRPFDPQALQLHSTGVYDCTLCGRCGIVCPAHIPTRNLWIAMRYDLVQQGVYPAIFNTLRDTLSANHNISGDDNSNRLIWSQNLPEIPEGLGKKQKAEVVFFVGCVSSFYPQCYSIPQSAVQVMEKVGLDYMALGGEEWCCGFPLIIGGMGDDVRKFMLHNVEAVRRTGARLLVTSCPSCYHTWKHDYPRLLSEPLGFEVLHLTELLAKLLRDGLITLRPLEETVTYHDPCDLGRSSGVYEAPREVIKAIPGIKLVEMKHNRELSLCCGGGGDVEMADKELTVAVAKKRIAEAQATGAKILLSACQQCKRTLFNAARSEKIRIRVLDVVELVAQQL